ncbi:hypothetical protein SDRG_06540 [Saprolegnia diclina VS20]|uniref:Uncharacterized protein n=1 Tax=Saprolegnia diclina (strain VS20) TaxID=1156394 RepID=T0QM37_SAPDV|nr:hypothetical protein SDRG_06540 [Saprolegnia diclina VS20]EQC35781.1 hypothetical protein SDRG_06540 [Saprolegnia diclina VS20]|eukprot:XP_008610543.1 hypothetical protein SDRG_06540 [Saprolegnia diclina VS20]
MTQLTISYTSAATLLAAGAICARALNVLGRVYLGVCAMASAACAGAAYSASFGVPSGQVGWTIAAALVVALAGLEPAAVRRAGTLAYAAMLGASLGPTLMSIYALQRGNSLVHTLCIF